MIGTQTMNAAQALADLFRRDLARLVQELKAFPNAGSLWQIPPGVSNSAGNLTLHLEGNLKEYIGRQLGRIDYHRQRDIEFTLSGLNVGDLVARVEEIAQLVPGVVEQLSWKDLEATYPEKIWNKSLSTFQFLIHLHGHLNYHLGQIDYLRRVLTEGPAIPFAYL